MKRCHSINKPELYNYKSETMNASKLKNLKPSTPSKDRRSSEKTMHSTNHQYLRSANKQENILPETSSTKTLQYNPSIDETPIVEVTVKTNNPVTPKQRSISTVSNRQPWGQLLSKHSTSENESVFGKFDPLRTLHFLARELQTNMELRLPGETNLQEIVKAMHAALKRIPPEVASTVQLQQSPKIKKCPSKDSIDYCYGSQHTENKSEFGEIQKLIEGSTKKLEASCKHLENICGELKDEKLSLEAMLQQERSKSKCLQIRLEDVEHANLQLSQKLTKKDEEIRQLKATLENLETKSHNEAEFQAQIVELKRSKSQQDQECLKLEHRLRLCAIEKEKYLAILAVRDRQIYEIKNEMSQLQESVNEQLMELHNYALASVPGGHVGNGFKQSDALSSIWANDEEDFDKKSNHSFRDLDVDDAKVKNQMQMPTHDIFQGIS